jgi:BirA family transcriptional regulator, biotin operon repressor / biotin---[acetyl-CoA-carboxylase] ligase
MEKYRGLILIKITNLLVPLKYTDDAPFIELQSVDSTNNYATALIHAGMAQHGTGVFAHEQNKGKGQRNKQWITQKSANIILSVVMEPLGLGLPQFFPFSMAMALGVHRFFSEAAGEGVTIKWPNDIMWRDRKAGGILIENNLQGHQWKFAVVGVGLNINQTDFGNLGSKAVSLKQLTGKDYDVVAMAKELSLFLLASLDELKKDEAAIMEQYHQQLYKINEPVTFKKGSRLFKATVKGVTRNGQLKVEYGAEELLDIGAVEWVI